MPTLEGDTLTLLDLGEHCFERICKYLALDDLVALSSVCKQLRSFVVHLPPNPHLPRVHCTLPFDVPLLNLAHWCAQGVIWDFLDVQELENVPMSLRHRLMVAWCGPTGIHDVTLFKGCAVVDLTICDDLRDITPLSEAREVSIQACGDLVDVSALQNCYKVELISLDRLQDVSSLRHCHHVDLSFCRGITDFSPLIHVHTLIVACTNFSDTTPFENGSVHELDASYCYELFDTAPLRHIHTLKLAHTHVTDVSLLGSVVNLDLSYTMIDDISLLGGCTSLNLFKCPNITDMSPVAHLEQLVMPNGDIYNDDATTHANQGGTNTGNNTPLVGHGNNTNDTNTNTNTDTHTNNSDANSAHGSSNSTIMNDAPI